MFIEMSEQTMQKLLKGANIAHRTAICISIYKKRNLSIWDVEQNFSRGLFHQSLVLICIQGRKVSYLTKRSVAVTLFGRYGTSATICYRIILGSFHQSLVLFNPAVLDKNNLSEFPKGSHV